MTRRLIGNLLLGLALGGCTVTNTIQNTVTVSQDEDGRVVTIDSDDDSTPPDLIELIVRDATDSPADKQGSPKKQNTQTNKQETKRSKYCDVYVPLAVPDPVKYDSKAYLAAVEVEDYAAASKVLAKNIVAVNKQMREYKTNLQSHHEAWKKSCGKH